MSYTMSQLSAEIATDPAGLGLPDMAAARDWAGIAAALNVPSPSYSKQVPKVPIAFVLMWAAGGPLEELVTGQTAAAAAQIRSICRACVLIFSSPSTVYLDLADARNTTMLGALVAAGVLTTGDRDSCLALMTVTPASRAEQAFGDGASVTYDQAHIAATAPWGSF